MPASQNRYIALILDSLSALFQYTYHKLSLTRGVCLIFLSLVMFLYACGTEPSSVTQTVTPIPSSTPVPTATPVPPTFWIQPGVPSAITTVIIPELTNAGYIRSETPDGTVIQIILNSSPDAILSAQWVYALVVPFPTTVDDISLQSFQGYWNGSLNTIPGFDNPPQIILTQDIAEWLTTRFGPAGASVPITIVDATQSDQIIDTSWNSRPSLSLVPFDKLQPRWKVLSIDGFSPLNKSVDSTTYPLTVNISAIAAGQEVVQAVNLLQSAGIWQVTNRDSTRISTVVLTGVTALVRATAYIMEYEGIDYPTEKILPFFADADILHTSNEVSFTPKCPMPELLGEEKFCSSPKYKELLQIIGLDVVELTGNHNNDYGTAPNTYSLDMYDELGIAYYGGGRNLTDAAIPRILTTPDGTRVAFVGCNSAGPYKAWATKEYPGASPCGDWTGIRQTIADLKANNQADIVIATLQYTELPKYIPSEQQRTDFEALAAAGADIVSGSQAHQPMGFSFASGKFIHFGVGNLFFDQMDRVENRQLFADKYILYQGRLISVVLFTGMMENYSQPRPMTPEERMDFLHLIFNASGW